MTTPKVKTQFPGSALWTCSTRTHTHQHRYLKNKQRRTSSGYVVMGNKCHPAHSHTQHITQFRDAFSWHGYNARSRQGAEIADVTLAHTVEAEEMHLDRTPTVTALIECSRDYSRFLEKFREVFPTCHCNSSTRRIEIKQLGLSRAWCHAEQENHNWIESNYSAEHSPECMTQSSVLRWQDTCWVLCRTYNFMICALDSKSFL